MVCQEIQNLTDILTAGQEARALGTAQHFPSRPICASQVPLAVRMIVLQEPRIDSKRQVSSLGG